MVSYLFFNMRGKFYKALKLDMNILKCSVLNISYLYIYIFF